MDLWERGIHEGLVWDDEAEGGAREGRSASGGKEEDDSVARSYHNTVLLGKLRKAVRQATVGLSKSWRGSPGGWTSGRGVSMRAWCGMTRQKGVPERAGVPVAGRRGMTL